MSRETKKETLSGKILKIENKYKQNLAVPPENV